MKLFIKSILALILGAVLFGGMLFLPAFTFNYPNAWLFLALLGIPTLVLIIVLSFLSPEMLAKRLNAKEKLGTQKGVIKLMGLVLPLGLILSALDWRFGWSLVPTWATVTASLLFLIGYGVYLEVMRENAYLSRTIEIQEGQTVVSTGLYGIVRHPMYLGTLLMFLPLSLILGSFWGAIPFALYLALIIVRIISEEKLLTEELEGYKEYKLKVKYRLIPFIW